MAYPFTDWNNAQSVNALLRDSAGNPVPVGGAAMGSTGTRTDVNDTNVSGTLLAANANRKSFEIFNDSTAILYLLLASGTASATNFTTILQPQTGRKFDGYTGIVVGVWGENASGAARITEIA